MLKISLYQILCVSLCKHINSYRKNQRQTTYRQTMSAVRGRLSQRQEPCIPYALSRSTSEIYGSDLKKGWRTDRNDQYIRQFLSETLRIRRDQRNRNTLWLRSKAHYFCLLRLGRRTHCQREFRQIWDKRGLFLFFLPPYSYLLNIAEIVWRNLKGVCLMPADYYFTDFLTYATNRALTAIGSEIYINFAQTD